MAMYLAIGELAQQTMSGPNGPSLSAPKTSHNITQQMLQTYYADTVTCFVAQFLFSLSFRVSH